VPRRRASWQESLVARCRLLDRLLRSTAAPFAARKPGWLGDAKLRYWRARGSVARRAFHAAGRRHSSTLTVVPCIQKESDEPEASSLNAPSSSKACGSPRRRARAISRARRRSARDEPRRASGKAACVRSLLLLATLDCSSSAVIREESSEPSSAHEARLAPSPRSQPALRRTARRSAARRYPQRDAVVSLPATAREGGRGAGAAQPRLRLDRRLLGVTDRWEWQVASGSCPAHCRWPLSSSGAKTPAVDARPRGTPTFPLLGPSRLFLAREPVQSSRQMAPSWSGQ